MSVGLSCVRTLLRSNAPAIRGVVSSNAPAIRGIVSSNTPAIRSLITVRRDSYATDASSSAEDTSLPEKSEFWRRKMRTFFQIHDFDKDGRVTWKDYVKVSEKFAQVVELNSEDEIMMLQKFKDLWEYWMGPATKKDVYVTEDKFLSAVKESVAKPVYETVDSKVAGKKQPIWGFFFKVFELIDRNADGKISAREYKDFFNAYGLSSMAAEEAFKAIDLNKDGQITMDEFVTTALDFFYTDDEARPSKSFFGSLAPAK